MSTLLSTSEIGEFVSDIQDHFDTFSQFHTVVVIKPPLKQIIDINDQQFNGFGLQNNEDNFINIPQSGVWNCMTYTPNQWEDDYFGPSPNILVKGDLVIKVEEEANNYINNGKTDFLIVDNENYTIEGGGMPVTYGTQQYFYYTLKRTL